MSLAGSFFPNQAYHKIKAEQNAGASQKARICLGKMKLMYTVHY